MTAGNLIEELEQRIVVLRHDLQQERRNGKAQITKLRNQLAKSEHRQRNLERLFADVAEAFEKHKANNPECHFRHFVGLKGEA